MSDKNNNCQELTERFKNAIEALERDKKTMEKIKDRNLLQMLFANNTRDLAAIGISMSGTISDLNAVIQEMLRFFQKSGENQAKLAEALLQMKERQSETNRSFLQEMCKMAEQLLNDNKKINKISDVISDHDNRLVTKEQIDNLCLDIKECGLKRDLSSIEQLERICDSIKENLTSFWVNNNHKRTILLSVSYGNFSTIPAKELNEKQGYFVEKFRGELTSKTCSTGIWEDFLRNQCKINDKEMVAMSEVVSGVIDAVTVSEGDRYIEFRQRLTGLLEDFIDLNMDIEDQYVPELKKVRKRLYEDQFEIVLVGEFQGGKSTTFNTLCGGREISPRGLNGGGIKTSAAIVTAQNITGDEKKNGLDEWAEISWLDKTAIKERVCDLLKIYDFDEATGKALLAKTPINTPLEKVGRLLKIAWEEERDLERIDLLRIATLQFRLLSSSNLDKYFQKEIVSVSEFQTFVTFPCDWAVRWETGSEADFTLEESLFTVVDHVLVRIHSPALARLGCRITDCPGLFVSKWDTERAINAMERANAIWYLLSGAKELGQHDEQALTKIKDNKWQNKCFFSINRCGNALKTAAIMKADTAKLKSLDFVPEQIYMYDAFLSFRLSQIKMLDSNLLQEKDFECLAMELAQVSSVEKSLIAELQNDKKRSEDVLHGMIEDHLRDIREKEILLELSDEFTGEDLAKLMAVSGSEDILNAIEKLLITERAKSILVTEGSQRCLDVLKKYQSTLLLNEANAEKNLQLARKEVAEAEETLNKFIKEYKEEFKFLESDSVDKSLTDDFLESNERDVLQELNERSIKICQKLWHDTSYWKGARTVDRLTEEKIKEEFLSLINAKLKIFNSELKINSVRFKNDLWHPLLSKVEKMKKRWTELQATNEILENLDLTNLDRFDDFKFDSFNQTLDKKIDTPSFTMAPLMWIFSWFKNANKRIEEFFREKDPIGTAYLKFKGDTENKQQIAKNLGAPRLHYMKILEECFANMHKTLDQYKNSKIIAANLSDQERKEIARQSKRDRENIIEPYTKNIEDFQTEVNRFYAK